MNNILKNFVNETLTEITRYEKETGNTFNSAEELKKYVSDKDFPEYAFSMTDLNKVGINPQSRFDTPIGVYFYPLNTRHFNSLLTNNLPHASGAKYCNLVKFVGLDSNKWLKFGKWLPSHASDEALAAAKQKFGSRGHDYSGVTNNDSSIYTILKSDASSFYHHDKRGKYFSSNLRYLGYIGVYDAGSGIIHENEPQQIVCLRSQAYQTIKTFETKEIRKSSESLEITLAKKIRARALTPSALRYAYRKFESLRTLISNDPRIPDDIVAEIVAEGDLRKIRHALKKISFLDASKFFDDTTSEGIDIMINSFAKHDAPSEKVVELSAKPDLNDVDLRAISKFCNSDYTITNAKDLDQIFENIKEKSDSTGQKAFIYDAICGHRLASAKTIKKIIPLFPHKKQQIMLEYLMRRGENINTIFSIFYEFKDIMEKSTKYEILRNKNLLSYPKKLKKTLVKLALDYLKDEYPDSAYERVKIMLRQMNVDYSHITQQWHNPVDDYYDDEY